MQITHNFYLFKYWDRMYYQIQGKSGEMSLLLIVGCELINWLFNIDWLIDLKVHSLILDKVSSLWSSILYENKYFLNLLIEN